MYVAYHCQHCPTVFETTGTMHGQPSGLWLLLEHMATVHDKETR